MAEQNKDQERNEEATPKKREQARQKGQVAKSREASSVAVLLAGLFFFWFGAGAMWDKILAITRWTLLQAGQFRIDDANIQALAWGLTNKIFFLLLPLFLVALIVGLFVNYIQVGFVFSADSLQPKFSKLDPIQGAIKLLSLKSLVELVKNILKLMIVGFAVYLILRGEAERVVLLVDQSVEGILLYIASVAFKIVLAVCLVLILLAVLDYAYQKWEFEKDLKMTKQEIKDESKQSDGDPLVKSRIRRLQREAARKRMMANVPKADVVITNPTHLAVALLYDQSHMSAPKVVAKGAGFVAETIRDIARKNNVPIVNDKPLARVLYKKVNVDETIPANLYRAVAEILAFVYGIKTR